MKFYRANSACACKFSPHTDIKILNPTAKFDDRDRKNSLSVFKINFTAKF
ncbi:hypothetical protein [uncultured Campylobacter sp.]|nr:hypothetical protein [uncultured Campylobacter sp.]